ncbi:MAG: PQQ-dependent sugar dehydrogenase [Thermoanaerobaculia bacterium]
MSEKPRTILVATAVLALAAIVAAAAPPIGLELVVAGIDRPVGVVDADDGSDRLFIFSLPGQIWIWDGERLLDEPFLDIADGVNCCFGERGMGGLAFHPEYADNGFFYAAYDGPDEVARVSRFRVSGNPNRANPSSERVLLRVPQPFPQHNLGQLAFGPDGHLYIGSGDGGSAGDPMNNSQDLGTLLGKILRVDVDGGFPYAIPPDNPFVDTPGARGEIWAYGIRNTWRFSFDRNNGDLYMGDVGQDGWEEINLQPGNSSGGGNYGWRLMEGTACFDPPTACNDGSLTLPILEYSHFAGEIDLGCKSVTGGYRYRGPATITLPRFYLFGDFCTGEIWGARPNAAGVWVSNLLLDSNLFLVSFGEDRRGRLYTVDFRGGVYRIVGRGTLESDFESGLGGFSGRRGNVVVTGPGLRGSAGALEVTLDGSPTISTVRSAQPRAETTFRLSFDFNANRADPGDGSVEILRLVDKVPHVKLALEPGVLGRRLALLARTGPGSFRRVGALGVPKLGVVRVTLDWMRASAPGVADGQAALTIGARRSLRATDLDNRGRIVKTVVLGLPSGSEGAVGGRLLFDNYSSTP